MVCFLCLFSVNLIFDRMPLRNIKGEQVSRKEESIIIDKPTLKDTQAIKDLLDFYAKKQVLLPRSIVEIYEKIRIFWVARDNGKVVGCVGLQFSWNDLAEIKSLAVSDEYHGKGIGAMLVLRCIEEAKEYGVKQIFALTYVSEFFKKLGFVSIEKEELPHKIWTECINCQHFPNCDEDAVSMAV